MSKQDGEYRPTPRRRAAAGEEQGRPATRRSATSPSRPAERTPARRGSGRSGPAAQVRSTRGLGRASSDAQAGNAGRRWVVPVLAALSVVLVGAFGAHALGGSATEPSPDAASQGPAASEAAVSDEAAKAAGPYSISFCTTGDLIFWREVADCIDANGGAAAMANIDEHLAAADVTIANVESPLSDDESEPVIDKDVYIIGRPSAIESIENSGIDLASLANNHIMDYTGPALEDTLEALDGAGVKHAGAGMTEAEAETPAELEVDGVKIAFFSWTDIVPDYFLAFGDEPGVVSARMNMDDACKRVREAKATHDIVIVAMHWGVEYEDYITDYLQSEPAHQLVDAGADVIVGNHPHVMEGIEFYKGSLIAYAHGNCVFWQKYDHTHESILVDFDMTDNGVENVVVTPLYLDDVYGIPDFATGEQARMTLERLEEISEGMNTAFDIRDGKAYVTPIEASSAQTS